MQFVNLKITLKTVLLPAYLLFGSDVYLVRKSIELIIEAANVTDKQLDVSKLDESATAEAIIAECSTVSFFGGKRVIVVRGANESQFTKALAKYLASPNPDCVLILVFDNEKNTVNLKNIEPVDCNPMTADIVIRLITSQIEKAGRKINSDAAKLLAELCVNNYAKIDNEINKLINFFTDSQAITSENVSQIVTKTEEFQIYELSNAVCKGDITKSQEILKVLQDSGVEDYAVFGNLVSSFRRLFYALTCTSSNETVAGFLKCSPYAVLYARRDNKNLAGKIASIYNQSLDLEYQIKSGKVSVNSAISLLQFACQA